MSDQQGAMVAHRRPVRLVKPCRSTSLALARFARGIGPSQTHSFRQGAAPGQKRPFLAGEFCQWVSGPLTHKFAFASARMALTARNARDRISRVVQEGTRRLLRASNEVILNTNPAPTGEYRLISVLRPAPDSKRQIRVQLSAIRHQTAIVGQPE